MEPALLRGIALGDRHERGNPRLGGQQVVRGAAPSCPLRCRSLSTASSCGGCRGTRSPSRRPGGRLGPRSSELGRSAGSGPSRATAVSGRDVRRALASTSRCRRRRTFAASPARPASPRKRPPALPRHDAPVSRAAAAPRASRRRCARCARRDRGPRHALPCRRCVRRRECLTRAARGLAPRAQRPGPTASASTGTRRGCRCRRWRRTSGRAARSVSVVHQFRT